MSETNSLDEIKRMLSSNLIRDRKRGIRLAAELLATDEQRIEARALLAKIAKEDLIQNVSEMAQAILKADDERQAAPASSYKSEARHMFGGRCPKGHVSYYDKRIYCPKQGNVTRATLWRDDVEHDEILVKCTTCGAEYIVPVPCEGYK